MATDAERYQFLRDHFSQLMITNHQIADEDGVNHTHVKCIDIAANPSADPESVDDAVDEAIQAYGTS